MNGKMKKIAAMLLLVSFLLVGVVMLTGCKKKSEPPPPPPPPGTQQLATAAIVQTTCPVMGGAINKDIFTEYKGIKVYFCCPGCKEKFEAKPEDYIAKLPQFKD